MNYNLNCFVCNLIETHLEHSKYENNPQIALLPVNSSFASCVISIAFVSCCFQTKFKSKHVSYLACSKCVSNKVANKSTQIVFHNWNWINKYANGFLIKTPFEFEFQIITCAIWNYEKQSVIHMGKWHAGFNKNIA